MAKKTITDFAELIRKHFPELKIKGTKDSIMEDHSLPWKKWVLVKNNEKAVTIIPGKNGGLDIIAGSIKVKVQKRGYELQAEEFSAEYYAMFGQKAVVSECETLKAKQQESEYGFRVKCLGIKH